MNNKYIVIKMFCFFVLLFSFGNLRAQNQDLLWVKAEIFFNENKFEKAAPLYAQLLSDNVIGDKTNDEYDIFYKYGVCLFLTEGNQQKSIGYFETASESASPKSKVFYYLGQAYQNDNQYQKAIDAYLVYKSKETLANIKLLKIDSEIEKCESHLSIDKIVQPQVIQENAGSLHFTGNIIVLEEFGSKLATIKISSVPSNDFEMIITSNKSSGAFEYVLPKPGQYKISVMREGAKTIGQHMKLSESCPQEVLQDLVIRKGSNNMDVLYISNHFPVQKDFEGTKLIEPVAQTTMVDNSDQHKIVSENANGNPGNLAIDLKTDNLPFDLIGTIYKVQVGAFRANSIGTIYKNLEDKGLGNLSHEMTDSGWLVFFSGKFQKYSEVVTYHKKLLSMGFKDAYPIAYVNNKKIALESDNNAEPKQVISRNWNNDKVASVQKVQHNQTNEIVERKGTATNIESSPNSSASNHLNASNESTKLLSSYENSNIRTSISDKLKSDNLPFELIGTKYKVQIGAFKSKNYQQIYLNYSDKGLNPLSHEISENGYLLLFSGEFFKYSELINHLNFLHSIGYKEAYSVAIVEGKKVIL